MSNKIIEDVQSRQTPEALLMDRQLAEDYVKRAV